MGSNMIPDSKVHGPNMGPIWGRQDPGGPHVGPMNLAIYDIISCGYMENLPLDKCYFMTFIIVHIKGVW